MELLRFGLLVLSILIGQCSFIDATLNNTEPKKPLPVVRNRMASQPPLRVVHLKANEVIMWDDLSDIDSDDEEETDTEEAMVEEGEYSPLLPIEKLRLVLESSSSTFEYCVEFARNVLRNDMYCNETNEVEIARLFVDKIKKSLKSHGDKINDVTFCSHLIRNNFVIPFLINGHDRFVFSMWALIAFGDIDKPEQIGLNIKQAFALALKHSGIRETYATFLSHYIRNVNTYKMTSGMNVIDPDAQDSYQCDPYMIAREGKPPFFKKRFKKLEIPKAKYMVYSDKNFTKKRQGSDDLDDSKDNYPPAKTAKKRLNFE